MSATAIEARLRVGRATGFRLDMDLALAEGRTVALLGPNGAGKSTVVDAIAGLVPLDAGRITKGGVPLDDPAAGVFVPPAARRVGVVFQDLLLFPHLSVVDNIAFGPRSAGIGRRRAVEAARRWIERLDLSAIERRLPRDLSGGEAQRVALARALAADPQLLLLDEPLSAVDASVRIGLRRFLGRHLGEFPGPRLLITHDPTDAFLLADEIHVVEHGRVTQVGTADDIRLRPRTRYVADLAGSNLLVGTARQGSVDTGGHVLVIADSAVSGEVLVTIRPTAVSVHGARPEGSARNVWETRVELVEPLGERVRLRTGAPLPLTAEVTSGAVSALGLEPGSRIWVAIKATEIGVEGTSPTKPLEGSERGPTQG